MTMRGDGGRHVEASMTSRCSLVGAQSGSTLPATSRGVSGADLRYAHAADVMGLAGVLLFAGVGWLKLADGMPVLASAVVGRDPVWSEICAVGFGRPIDLGAAAAAWGQSFALSSAMIAGLMAPLAAPWRRLRRSANRDRSDWAAFAAYAAVWLAAEACVDLIEVYLKALGSTIGATLASADVLKLLLFAAAIQRVQGARLGAPSGTVGRDAPAPGGGLQEGLTAGMACVRANLLAMMAMCVAGAVSLPALVFLVIAMAIDRLAPSAAGSLGGRLTFAGLAVGLSIS